MTDTLQIIAMIVAVVIVAAIISRMDDGSK